MENITFYRLCVALFCIQLALCFKAGNKHIRRLPVYLHIIGMLLAVEWFFDIFDIHSGWDELAAMIVGVIVGCSGLAVLFAWIVYFVYRYFKNKKATKTE